MTENLPRHRVQRVIVGWTLVFGPVAVVIATHALTGSAILAATAGLSLSPVLQLLFECIWPRDALPPRSGRQLGIEIFQGVVYGSVIGVAVILGLWWGIVELRAAAGIEWMLAGGLWLQALVLVVAGDFLDYFRHRHEHESDGLFWRVHSVHHSIRGFSLLTGLAIHPLEPVFTYASYGLVAGLLGLSFDATLIGFALALIVMGAQHTNTDSSLGWLSYVLAHTDGHRWHHDLALESGRNVNYANVLTLWDLLWGSWYAPRDFDGEYGIEPFRDAYPRRLLDQLLIVVPGRYARAAQAAQRAGG